MAISLQSVPTAINSPAALSFSVGLFLAIIGATLGIGPIAILLIALVYFWKERSRARLLISIPVFQYLIVQFALTWWHSGEIFAIEMQNYYLLLFFAVPVIHFFVTDFDFDKSSLVMGVVSGLAISTAILAYDFFTAWNDMSCRAMAFQTNPLRTTLHMVPLASLLIALQAQKGRFGWMSAGLVILMLFTAGNLTGSRMTFYSIFVVLALVFIFFMKFKNFLAAKSLAFSVAVGLIFVVTFDTTAGCDFMKRLNINVTNSFSILASKALDSKLIEESVEAQIEEPVEAQKENSALPNNGETHQENSEITSEGIPISQTSEGIRLSLWKGAVASIRAHPFLGEGALREVEIARLADSTPGGGVTHNQYLSWAIWGGVVSLISAVLLMSTHFLTTQNRFAAAVFIIPWLTSSLTISTLYQEGTFAEFVVTLVVLMPLLGIKKTRWILSRPS